MMEDGSVQGTLEEQVLPRGTGQINLPAPPQDIPRGVEDEMKRYPTRKRKPNVRLNDYVVEVDRVRAMAVRSYAEVLKGTREEPPREEPHRGPERREQEIMMLSGVLEVVMEKLMMAMVEDPGRREI